MQPLGMLIEGKYEILEKIREGGMGTIYKVRHRLLDEIRVIKVIRPQAQADPDLKRRFTEEAKTATRLKHPNIATIYDFALDEDGTAYLVMEFLEGVNLADLRASQGALPLPLVLEIAHQTLSALSYLHRKNVVHRDVAPDNLMLTRDEAERPRVKLIDLGIAKALDRPADLTSTGMFLGKLKYASPEQYGALPPGEKLDGRSDLYAFGVVLYELLTGSRPFTAETPAELLKAHLTQPPIPFSDTDTGKTVPPELRNAVLKALEKQREDRFASADDFDQVLEPLRRRYPLAGSLDPTLVIPSARRATPSSPAAPVTPGVQDRLDRQFAGARTPDRTDSLLAGPAQTSRDAAKPRGCTVRIAMQFAMIAVAAVAVILVLRIRPERNLTGTSTLRTPGLPGPTQNAPPTAVAVATNLTPAQTPERVMAVPVRKTTPVESSPVVTAVQPSQNATPMESPGLTPSPDKSRTTPARRAEESHLRAAADVARNRSAQARERAEAAEAPQFAAALYEGGRAQEDVAHKLQSRGDSSGARVAFDLATRQYERSESAARLAPRPSPTRERRRPTPFDQPAAAEAARARCSEAQTRASQSGAAALAVQPYRAGKLGQRKAQDLLARGDLAGARATFDRATHDFEEAWSLALDASRSGSTRGDRKSFTEQSQIRETIRLAERAQNTLDVELYLRVFPSLDRRRVETAFSGLRSQTLRIEIRSIDVAPDRTHALARVYETRVVTPKEGVVRRAQGERVIHLEKKGDRWNIARFSRG